jgi:hypothetical protein
MYFIGERKGRCIVMLGNGRRCFRNVERMSKTCRIHERLLKEHLGPWRKRMVEIRNEIRNV